MAIFSKLTDSQEVSIINPSKRENKGKATKKPDAMTSLAF
ncbi:hypothetical protein HMPREF0653_01333 [Prevotella disiens JCM 6334 = ATCC 29426]|uniref:Uncharacterized protein n=1 Tax=Prevotella disiens JCM 6334 = ATCC 29426 TaxID=1235811 RepID=A0ABP2Y796_9BACT|nr:hypothetical protein HMPREF0653_01333 [Prevotella disiens JCM 6334 = ATCC 29426]